MKLHKASVIPVAVLLSAFVSCSRGTDYTGYVNPFIGTGGHGHTFPGVTLPNGMVQISPDTRMSGWDACSGYHYSDSTIIGFSHTHLSGTGIGDYGDILFMPTVDCPHIGRGDEKDTESGYRSGFSHNKEVASPGYYSVELDDYSILAEFTATCRTALHRYTFPESDSSAIIIDLTHTLQGHKNIQLEIRQVSETEISGLKRTKGWAKDQPVYFHAEFSRPFKAEFYKDGKRVPQTDLSGQDLKVRLNYRTEEGEQILAKVGISSVDENGARNNLASEQKGWDFDRLVKQARNEWNRRLSVIEIETDDLVSKRIFYTGLYHSLISPNIFSDADGRYRGQDHKIHKITGGQYYTVFSLWDTFRGLHPLLTITDPSGNESYVRTLLRKYDEGGLLPKWDLASNYTGTMIGYHAVSVIAEAYLKGMDGFDHEKALEACIESSKYHKEWSQADKESAIEKLMPVGLMYKDSLGYIPGDKDNESVAKGLEYAYNDWCIAMMAKKMGKDDIYREYLEKSRYYSAYFDPDTGFMRGRMSDGSWREPFDPRHSNHRKDDYCEGNAWQWSWFVPHDIDGLVALHGGKTPFLEKLDSLFTVSSVLTGDDVSGDISGLIGQYAHGNEPSHHISHIFNYLGESYRTQEIVDTILRTLYFDNPNGLSGNEDCGQMSAWYVLNAMGFYPIAPAGGEYSFGRPLFDSVRINLQNGKKVVMNIHENSVNNKYIEKLKINGTERDRLFVSHEELMEGATIDIWMSDIPGRNNMSKK